MMARRSHTLLRSLRRLLLQAFPLALGLMLLLPSTSLAHAILLRSDPARDAVLTSAPGEVHMWFSEDLNPGISKAVVLMANQHLADGSSAVSSSDTHEMDFTFQSSLAPGDYLVIWRTQSADDGHLLSGSFLFKVANPDGTVPNQTINPTTASDLLGDTTSNQFDGTTLFSTIMIALVDLAVVFWVGAQLWQNFVLQTSNKNESTQSIPDREAEQRFQQHFSLPTLFVILLANIGILLGQSLSINNGNLGQALSPTILHNLIANGRFGTYWTLREVVVFIAILIAVYSTLAGHQRQPRIVKNLLPSLNLLLGLILLIAVTLSGHAGAVTSTNIVYSVLIDWLHLLAASLWIGGMLYLSLIYLPVIQKQTSLERTRSLLTILPHFSPLAIVGVIIMAVTGPFNATFHMTSFSQLVATAYGRTLIIKSALVCAMLIVSAIHVGLLRPRLLKDYKKYAQVVQDGESAEDAKSLENTIASQTRRLGTTLRWEPLLGVAVLICTGLLNVFAGTLTPTTVAPPAQQQVTTVKPYTGTLKTSDNTLTVQLTVSPARFGPNTFTVIARDSSGKVQSNVGVTIYTTMLDMDMGTNSLDLQPDSKGNFTGTGDLDMSGHWQLRVQIRTVDNKLHEAQVKIVAA
jgi:copper transport protein